MFEALSNVSLLGAGLLRSVQVWWDGEGAEFDSVAQRGHDKSVKDETLAEVAQKWPENVLNLTYGCVVWAVWVSAPDVLHWVVRKHLDGEFEHETNDGGLIVDVKRA